MKTHIVGIIMNGVTGRMGTNQHLVRSILAIREQGGIRLGDAEVIMPEPVLVGRNAAKVAALAEKHGIRQWATDLEAALRDPAHQVYFDAQSTSLRPANVKRAIAAGKHVYCEKPTALTTADACELYALAKKAGVRHGVVQDKLWLPGIQKLRMLVATGFFGRILSVRGDFGYWVFEGDHVTPQRPSWNYRKEEGGGIIFDMFAHWRYVLDTVFGNVRSVCCRGATHIEKRWDEEGRPYACTADDAAYGMFELAGGVVAQFNSSWCTRVRRDDLLTIQVDGTAGSAVAGLRECTIQPMAATPRPCGTRTSITRSISATAGPASRTSRPATRMRSRPSGSCSSSTSSAATRSRGRCSKGPRACNSPNWRRSRGESGRGSTCRSSK